MSKNFFLGSVMSFEVENKAAFEIPLQDVSQATTGSYFSVIKSIFHSLKFGLIKFGFNTLKFVGFKF